MNKSLYKLVHKDTGEIATYGDDNTVIFGGPWGRYDDEGNPYYIWVENLPAPEELKAEKINALNAEYIPAIEANDRAYAIASRKGNTELVAQLNTERDQLEAEYNQKMEDIQNGN
jgi:hypothetical protein